AVRQQNPSPALRERVPEGGARRRVRVVERPSPNSLRSPPSPAMQNLSLHDALPIYGALCKPCWRAAKSLARTAGEGAFGRRPQTAEERTSALPPLAALACRPLHAKERHKRGPAQLVGRGPR